MNNNILLFSVSIEILNLLSLVGLLYLISTFYGTFKWRWSKEQVALLLLIVAGIWLFSVPMKRITLIYSASILYTLPTIDQLKQSPSQIATVVHPIK